MRLMCPRAIRVWVCAYRVLLAAVDEVELDKDSRCAKFRSIFTKRVRERAGLRFADASAATQSSRVLSDNTNHALRDGIAERRRQRSHQAPGGNLCCMENTLVSIGGVLPRSWVRHFVAHTCCPWPQPARHLYQLVKIRSAEPQSLSLGCTVHRESCRAGQSS